MTRSNGLLLADQWFQGLGFFFALLQLLTLFAQLPGADPRCHPSAAPRRATGIRIHAALAFRGCCTFTFTWRSSWIDMLSKSAIRYTN